MVTRMSDQLGRLLGGRYRLVAPIGTGASAQVFLADDLTLGRRVAVKVLHPALATDEGFLRRFRDEARAAAALSHPNLMAVYDWGEDDGPYLVLEHLGGGSLRSLLDRGHRLSPSQALLVGLDAARALDVAHRRGFVHRDIKPANLLFGEDGRLRVADFGLARALSEAGWTEPGDLVGTARYAAPEQARGGRVDGKADVYALGLVLIEAVTGTVPLTREGALETMMARVDTPVPVPDDVGLLRPILERAGRPDPAGRPDAGELGRFLVTAARTMERPAPLPLPAATPGSDDEHTLASEPGFVGDDITMMGRRDATGVLPAVDAGDRSRRRRWPWFLLAVLVVAAVAVGGVAVWSQVQTPSAPVPDVSGRPIDEARSLLAEAQAGPDGELRWEVVEEQEHNEGVAAGVVIRQRPSANAELDDGGTVTVVVSRGPPPVTVPDLFNFTEEEATGILDDAGLAIGDVSSLNDEVVEAGRVLTWRHDDVDRPAEIPKGSEVDLVVSSGPAARTVPQLRGSTFEAASEELAGLGLEVGRQEAFHDEVPAGQVIGTDPAAGREVARGATVTVVISKGPDLVTVPDVRGKSLEEAVAALEAAGLEPGEVFGPARGRPDSTDPGSGERVRRGTTVDIYLRR